ncbi:MAG: sulfotransferase, partial [Deltaproteobacteria bacterium]|nr:sulfotransferase [Deltaproteobacteria bacterium]
ADPSLRAIHFMMPDGPEECRHLMAQTFTDDGLETNAHVPSYSEWYQHVDMTATYRRHLDLVKLIGSTDTERTWLLKYPVHMRHIDAFLEVYPDACIVQTHRDPAAVLHSYLGLICGFRSLFEDEIDRREIATRQLELWAAGAEKCIEVRKQRKPEQFYDLYFRDFMTDPIAEVKRMYGYFGRQLSEAGEQSLRAWHEDNPQHKHGKFSYSRSDADVGVSREEILDRFAAYMDYYGMEPERK